MIKALLRRLSGRAEFLLVFVFAFGVFVPGNLAAVMELRPDPGPAPPITDAHLAALVVYELAVLVVLLPFLNLRGWTIERLGGKVSVRDWVTGPALAVAAYAGYIAFYLAIGALVPNVLRSAAQPVVASHLSWSSVITVCVVNPIFEEVFVCGYLISTLKERIGPHWAVNVSTGVRMFYHAYQGMFRALGVAPFGLILGYWYVRTNRLWPLVIAHALTDFLGLWLSATIS